MNIAEPTGIMRHFEALAWINNLMIDLKLTLGGLPPQREITIERLHEFDQHARNLLRCQVPATTSRYDTRTFPKHRDVEHWLNDLIVDVMKPLLGYKPGPLTLNAWPSSDRSGRRLRAV